MSQPPNAPPAGSAPPRPGRPWWIPFLLGRVPALSQADFRMFGLVVLGTFFESYDLSLLSSAAKHIADDLAIGSDDLAFVLAAVRIGGFVAFALLPLADRVGRRRMFLAAILGMSVFTLVTALVQTPLQFVAAQVATRTFLSIAASVGVVMLAEELPAEHRGWGIGMLGALGALGHGLGAALFALVDVLPFGWRALYGVGALPIFALPWMRRSLRETARFEAHRARASEREEGRFAAIRSLGELARSHPGRALCVGLASFSLSFGAIAVFQFAAYFLQTVHAWAPWHYSTMMLVGGGIGIAGNVVAGRLGDVLGRRAVGFVALAAYPMAAVAFYQGPEITVGACFALIVFLGSAADVVLRAFSTELFPTSQRGASAGWFTLLGTLGNIGGLVLVGGGVAAGTNLPLVISAVSFVVLLAAVCVLVLPESRGRELETLSHDA